MKFLYENIQMAANKQQRRVIFGDHSTNVIRLIITWYITLSTFKIGISHTIMKLETRVNECLA